jgi:hypothetical protein
MYKIKLGHAVQQLVEGTALQAGMSRVRFPMGLYEFFIVLIFGSPQPLTEMSTKVSLGG